MEDGEGGRADEATASDPLQDWRQGDYTLDLIDFPSIALADDGGLDQAFHDVVGVAVVTQTCDIVNCGVGKDTVVVAPLVRAPDGLIRDAVSGRSPTYALLENAPARDVVVDLNRMATVQKAVVRAWKRSAGFTTDEGRTGFAGALERKHGRFAYPDAFVRVISKWRTRIIAKHDKDSAAGRVYSSVRMLRVAAYPHWEADSVEVLIFVVLEDGYLAASQVELAEELRSQIDGIALPKGYSWAEGRMRYGTLDQLTARDIHESQVLDLMFLSGV